MSKLFKLSGLILVLLPFSGCDLGYWWQRGQPPGVETILERSTNRLSEALELTNGQQRNQVAGIAKQLQATLDSIYSTNPNPSLSNPAQNKPLSLDQSLDSAKNSFLQLEGKLSIGSRAAFSELSGQLRRFIEKSSSEENFNYDAFGLFAARTMFFLSRELMVPAPNFG